MASPLDKLTNNWQLKLTAVVLAFLFWAALRREQPYRYTTDVPLKVVIDEPGWVLSSAPDPPTVRVTLMGPGGELLQVASQPPQLLVPVEDVPDSAVLRVLQPGWVMYGELPNTSVEKIEPATVRLAFERLTMKLLPLAIELTGEPAEGYELVAAPVIDPPVVRASGGVRRLARMEALRIPLSLDGRAGVDTLEVPLDTTGTGLVLSPDRVRVILTFRAPGDSLAPQRFFHP